MSVSFRFVADLDRPDRFDVVSAARSVYLDSIGSTGGRLVGDARFERDRNFDRTEYRRYNVIVAGVRVGWVGTSGNGWHSTVDTGCRVSGPTTYYSDHPTRYDAVMTVVDRFSATAAPL